MQLEQKQRDARKALEAEGKAWQPLWFDCIDVEATGEENMFATGVVGKAWRYKGGYFDQPSGSAAFDACPVLW